MPIDVITISSKGQIVIPSEMRSKLSLDNGDKLAAYCTNDAIVLKPIKLPTEDDFEQDFLEAQEWARSVGYKPEDVDTIIKEVRARKRQAK